MSGRRAKSQEEREREENEKSRRERFEIRERTKVEILALRTLLKKFLKVIKDVKFFIILNYVFTIFNNVY